MRVSAKTNETIRVRGTLGKRLEWVEKNTNLWPENLERQGKKIPTYGYSDKNWRWAELEHGNFNGSRDFQRITAFDKTVERSVFLQPYIKYPFWYPPQLRGVLISKVPQDDEYLCFFKDCGATAVVRAKEGEGDTYLVIGRAIDDKPHIGDWTMDWAMDWTMECDVEMSLETLQLLTR